MSFITSLLKWTSYIFIFVSLLGFINTFYLEHTEYQKKFAAGKVPSPLPSGFMKGTAVGIFLNTVLKLVPWQGKTFNQEKNTGINIIAKQSGGTKEEFPFKSWVGKGIRDKKLETFKIDYDIPENAFWLRCVLDEVVEVEPGHFLGKMQIVPFKGFAITLGYFELRK